MRLEDSIKIIKRNKEPKGLVNIIFYMVVSSSDLLYSPSQDEEYNEKHRLECVIFSAIVHIAFVEIYHPNLFQKVKMEVASEVKSLIENSEPVNGFTEFDFIMSFTERYKFYGQEISKIPNSSNTLPLKLLSLIYDKPLILDIAAFQNEPVDIPD